MRVSKYLSCIICLTLSMPAIALTADAANQSAFYGVTPAVTTEQEVLNRDDWGKSVSSEQPNDRVRILEFKFGIWKSVRVLTEDKIVRLIDVTPPDRAPADKLAEVLQLGALTRVESRDELPPGCLAGPGINQNWESLTSSQMNDVVLFVDDSPRRYVMLMRLFSQRSGFLGISLQTFNTSLARHFGVDTSSGILVGHTLNDSPAKAAGLKSGDVIIEFADTPVTDEISFIRTVKNAPPGVDQTVVVLRDGKRQNLPVRIASRPENLTTFTPAYWDDRLSLSRVIPEDYGFSLSTGEVRTTLRPASDGKSLEPVTTQDEDAFGRIVTSVEPGGLAADAGIKVGARVVSIQNHAIENGKDVVTGLRKTHAHRPLLLNVELPVGGVVPVEFAPQSAKIDELGVVLVERAGRLPETQGSREVVISTRDNGSIAHICYLDYGEVILDFDQKPIRSINDFRDALAAADLDGGVLVRIKRASGTTFKTVSTPERVIADLTEDIRLSPENPSLRRLRSTVYTNLGRHAEALEDLDAAISFKNDAAMLWGSRGHVLFTMGDHDRAKSDFDQAIRLDEEVYSAWLGRGKVYQAQGKFDLALTDFTRLTEIAPKYSEGWYLKALAHESLGQPEEALPAVQTSLDLSPGYEVVWSALFRFQKQLGRLDDALRTLDQVQQLAPNSLWIRLSRCQTLQQMGLVDKAIESAKDATSLAPEDPRGWKLLGDVQLYTKKDHKSAVASYQKAVDLKPDYGGALHNLGYTELQLGKLDDAVKTLTTALDHNDIKWGVLRDRGRVFLQKRDYDRAMADFEKAIKEKDDVALLYQLRGQARHQNGLTDRALEDLNKAVSMDKNNGYNFYNRGLVYQKKANYNKALEDFTDAIRLMPRHGHSFWFRGQTHFMLGNKETAEKDRKRSVELDPSLSKYKYQ